MTSAAQSIQQQSPASPILVCGNQPRPRPHNTAVAQKRRGYSTSSVGAGSRSQARRQPGSPGLQQQRPATRGRLSGKCTLSPSWRGNAVPTWGSAYWIPFTPSIVADGASIQQSDQHWLRMLHPPRSATMMQGWALENVVVPAARMYGLESEYQYLRPSIKRFPKGGPSIRVSACLLVCQRLSAVQPCFAMNLEWWWLVCRYLAQASTSLPGRALHSGMKLRSSRTDWSRRT